MTISMYQSSVPVFIEKLNNLSAILEKGLSSAKARNINEAVFVNARLAPDMFPLSRQVQIACDVAKIGSARIAGIEFPSFEDNESTFEELQNRIKNTILFLQTIDSAKIDNTENKEISYNQRGKDYHFIGQNYLLNYVIPNIYFHITTTYLILRNNGVDLGKKDYLGKY